MLSPEIKTNYILKIIIEYTECIAFCWNILIGYNKHILVFKILKRYAVQLLKMNFEKLY